MRIFGLVLIIGLFTVGWAFYQLHSVVPPTAGRTEEIDLIRPCTLSVEPKLASTDVFEEVTTIPFVFTIRNGGSDAVTINEIKPSCGCTVVKLESNVIPASGSVQFTAVYKVEAEFGKLPPRRITISSNNASCQQLSCEIAGTRHRRFTITPPTVDFGNVIQGRPATTSVKIQAHGSDMRLVLGRLMTTNSAPRVDVAAHGKNADGEKTLELSLSLPPELPIGGIDGKLFIPRKEDDGIGPVVHFRGIL